MKRNFCLFLLIFCLYAGGCRQADERKVTVEATGSNAVVTAWERYGEEWKKKFSTDSGFVGQAGVVSVDEKQEGDKATPTGEYKMYRAFGMIKYPDTALEYTLVQPGDVWVDDPSSVYYNQYVPASANIERAWNTAEELAVLEKPYKYAIVVEYNTDPIVPGKGSAIFLNCSPNRPIKPTSGDIAVPEKYMEKLFKFVQPGDKIEIKQPETK